MAERESGWRGSRETSRQARPTTLGLGASGNGGAGRLGLEDVATWGRDSSIKFHSRHVFNRNAIDRRSSIRLITTARVLLFAQRASDSTPAVGQISLRLPQKVKLRMRPSPSIVPPGDERDVYLVLDDFGRLGRSWVEADEHDTYRESVIRDLLSCQYNDPVRVIVFNTEEGTSRDVSADIAHELIERTADRPEGLPECLSGFVDRYGAGLRRPVQLSLPIAT